MVKKVQKTRPGRGSDQFVIRMPPGMRDHLAKLAGEHGRSMNSEILEALERYIANDLPGTGTPISQEGLDAISKRLEAAAAALELLYRDARDSYGPRLPHQISDLIDRLAKDERKLKGGK